MFNTINPLCEFVEGRVSGVKEQKNKTTRPTTTTAPTIKNMTHTLTIEFIRNFSENYNDCQNNSCL